MRTALTPNPSPRAPVEAETLLRSLIEPQWQSVEAAEVAEIALLCGWLPLALRIAGGTLNRSAWVRRSLSCYVQQLQDERKRLSALSLAHSAEQLDVQASFNLSYQTLKPQTQQLLSWLGLLEVKTFGVEIAMALIGERISEVEERLSDLLDGQLLEPADSDRFQFHS